MEKDEDIARIHNRIQALPAVFRITIGIAFLIGGIFGVLPIVGFWMFPIGLLILSFDFPWAKRAYVFLKEKIGKLSEARKRKKQH